MSSILDALKKLEQEKEEQKEEFEWPQPVNTKGAIYQSVTRRPSYKPFVAGAVALVAVSLGAWFMVTRHSAPVPEKAVTEKKTAAVPRPPVAQKSFEKPTPKPEPEAKFKLINRHPSRMAKRPEGTPPHAPHMVPKEPVPQTTPDTPSKAFTDEQVKALAEIMPQNTEQDQPDLKALWDERLKEEADKKSAPVSMAPETTEPEQPELDEEMAELLERVPKGMLPPKKVVESGWLKLQAISWSDDPARRIAVINSNLVKEGRQIEGALVSRIERDYVVIEKNGEELMLPFGNH